MQKIISIARTAIAMGKVFLRPWSVYFPFAKNVHKVSVAFRLLRIRLFLGRNDVDWSETLKAIFVAIPKSASSAVTEELFHNLGDWKRGEGGLLVAGDLKELFESLKSAKAVGKGPLVLSMGHQGVNLLTRAGVIGPDCLRRIPIICVTRNDLERFPSAYSYCKKVRTIPRGIGVDVLLSLLESKGLPDPDTYDQCLDYGPPIHFAPSSAWTSPKSGFVPDKVFDMGTLEACIDYVCELADGFPRNTTQLRETNRSHRKPQLDSKSGQRLEKLYGLRSSS